MYFLLPILYLPINYSLIEHSIVIIVPYVTVNIYNYSRLVVIVTNNPIGLIFSRVGYRDLGIYFSNKLGS